MGRGSVFPAIVWPLLFSSVLISSTPEHVENGFAQHEPATPYPFETHLKILNSGFDFRSDRMEPLRQAEPSAQ